MNQAAAVTYLRIQCPTCQKHFLPNPMQLRREILIVCPKCLSPYVPAAPPQTEPTGLDD